jgi:hypothetical protein
MTSPDVVFVLGAGASLAEAQARRPVQAKQHPPLDATFFSRVAAYRPDEYRDRAGQSLWASVSRTAERMGEPDLGSSSQRVSLESHLGRLYFNVQHNPIASGVSDYFRMVDLYAREVIGTTEWMIGHRPGRKKELLRRMLAVELASGQRAAIVTFNIDLLIENTLDALSNSRPSARWSLDTVYGFSDPLEPLVGTGDEWPKGATPSDIPVYKMHGSVNWVFKTRDYYPGADLLGKRRELYVLREKLLGTGRIHYRAGKSRPWMLFPLIVPPVYEKHILIRNNLAEVWANAEAALAGASRVIFWGYSFPSADTHARHFFQALSQKNAALKAPVLINPDPGAGASLWEVLRPRIVTHYVDARAYLAAVET